MSLCSRTFQGADETHSFDPLVDVLLECLFRQDTKVTNVAIALIFLGRKHLAFGKVAFGSLLLLGHRPAIFDLLALHSLEGCTKVLDLVG